MTRRRPTLGNVAAGAVCYRVVDGKVKVLLVHRAYRDDVSFPKGKVDPGEALPITAVRELEEETGLRLKLGAWLDITRYRLPSRKLKYVTYWQAEVSDEAIAASTFESNGEIGDLQWAGFKTAKEALTYPRDRQLLKDFKRRVKAGLLDTVPIVLLRHCKAKDATTWRDEDRDRPLGKRGVKDAVFMAELLSSWSIDRIVSSDASRCLQTVEPLSARTGIPVEAVTGLSQDAYVSGTDTLSTVAAELAGNLRATVVCSHGPVLPSLAAALSRHLTGVDDAAFEPLQVGEAVVLHVSRSTKTVVSIERYGPDDQY